MDRIERITILSALLDEPISDNVFSSCEDCDDKMELDVLLQLVDKVLDRFEERGSFLESLLPDSEDRLPKGWGVLYGVGIEPKAKKETETPDVIYLGETKPTGWLH